MKFYLSLILVLTVFHVHAVIHKRTQYFLDIELNKKYFLIDCYGGLENNNSIVGFHLLDGDKYYYAHYRRVWPMKECRLLRKAYLKLLKNSSTVRLVIDHPIESNMSEKSKKEWPAPFNKAKKMISGPFIRLQSGDKCKAYFSEHCDLPKNYWGGVNPE